MKQRITHYTVLLLSCGLLLLGTTQLKASHIMGGDITYNCIGPNTFAFTAQFYQDCNGINLPNSVPLTITSASCGLTINITLELVPTGPLIVTPLCPGEIDACNSGAGTYGIQQYTYTHIPPSQSAFGGLSDPPVVLPAGCTDWVVSWTDCCRNGAITTGPSNNGFYIETMLNNVDAPCNNSPAFLNTPTPYACIGETVNYSHGVSEWDGDSLVFSLTPCLTGASNPVNYGTGFSGTTPLSTTGGVAINSQTGAITFTPNMAQVGVICVLVEEYRNGVKVGHVMRDIQFTVLNCTNSLPLASGANGTAGSTGATGIYDIQVCEGETINFGVYTFDTLSTGQTSGENISMSWNGGINSPNASFTVFDDNTDSTRGQFTWATNKTDAGFHIFTVNLQDDACPINGVNIFTFSVTIHDVPDVDAGGYQISCVAGDTITLSAVGNTLDSLYQWNALGGGTILSPNTLSTDILPASGAYQLIKTYEFGCIDSNVVAVDISPGVTIPTIPGSNICLGDSVQLDATIAITANPPTTFSNTTPVAFAQTSNPDTIYSTLDVLGIQPGIFDISMLQSVCIDVTYPFNSFLTISLISPNGTIIDLSSNNGGSSGNYTGTCFSPDPANPSITTGSTPFTGTFQPEQSFSGLTGDVVNGTWQLMVSTSTGLPIPGNQINSWNMTFLDITDTMSYAWTPTTDLSCATCSDPWASPTTPTTYTVIATDYFNCTDTQSIVVDVISALTAPVVTCCQVATTSLTFCWGAITGATGYEVSTDNGATWVVANGNLQHQLTGLALGQSVTVLVRGTSNCPGVAPTGTQTCTTTPCTLDATFVSSTDVTCNAGLDGTLDVTATGGTTPYTFQIVAGSPQNSGSFTGLAAGNYIVSVSDFNGCPDTVQVTINEPTAITFTTDSTLTNCNGSADGTAIVTATGGTGVLTYLWDANAANQTTNTATALLAGTYNVTITDASACFTTGSVTVNEPPVIVLDSFTIDVSCNVAMDGSAKVLVQGGTAGYTYAWSANANGQTTDSIVGLSGGTYMVTVTDANGCTDNISMYVDEATAIVLTTSMTQATCNGLSDGTATVSATGGTPSATGTGYTYQWGASANNQTTATATGLPTGTHDVTVTDGAGCTSVISETVTAPASMVLSVTSIPSTSCSYTTDGSAVVTPSGGSGGYTYLWGAGTNPMDSAVTGLATGTTYVTVTDVNGCSDIDSVVIAGPPPVVANPTPAAISCNGADDGTVTLAPVGGTGALSFAWSNGDVTQDITGLSAGTYIVTITDGNSCVFLDTAIIVEPDTLQTLATMTPVSCLGGNNGTASALPMGGQGGYTYLWSPSGSTDSTALALNAGMHSVTVTDAAGCTDTASVMVTQPATAVTSTITATNLLCNGDGTGTATIVPADGTVGAGYTFLWDDVNAQTTATATGLQAGLINVTVTDGNGCTTTNSITLTEPVVLGGTPTGLQTSCFGSSDGSASIAPTGGTAGYTYNWSPAISTDSFATNLSAGWHTVTITDANACTYIDSFEVLQPTQVTTTTTVDSASCNGSSTGMGSVTAAGGTPSYTYAWSFGGVTTPAITGLPAGWHYVTVTDANLCTAVDSIEVLEPVTLTTSMTQVDVLCFGAATGTATVTGAGGTLNYSYLWDGNALNQTTATASSLTVGQYFVTVTDLNGCTAVDSVTILEPATPVSSTTSGTDLLCNGDGSGTVTVVPAGGTVGAGYTFLWDDVNAQTTATATGLQAGTYNVTVTDGSGCTTTNTIIIGEPTALSGTTTGLPASCFGVADGAASITPAGGTAGYSYNWSPAISTDSFATNLSAGWHFVTVTDAQACTYVDSFEVLQPIAITTTTTVDSTFCNGDATGQGSVTAAGGNGGFTYAWSFGGVTTAAITGLPAGWHYVTVTDINNCFTVDSIEVLEPVVLTTSTTQVDVLCFGSATGSATVTGAGGTLNYTYLWDGNAANQTTATASSLTAGQYFVTVTDLNGCTAVDSVTILEPATPVSSTTSGTDLLCNGDGSGTVTVVPAGGTVGAGYTFLWDDANAQTTATATGLQAGIYNVTVTDGSGCTTTNTVTIGEPTPLGGVTAGTAASCFGVADGIAMITPSGATPGYTYLWSPSASNATDSLVTGLPAGTHYVTVTDNNMCTYVDSFEVLQPIAITTTTSTTPVPCFGDSTGTAMVTPAGGNGGFTFMWSFGNVTSQNITGLPAGWHYVTVTDVNGCFTTDSVEILEPTLMTLSTTQVDVDCFGQSTGSATAIPTGGTPTYTYAWDANTGNQVGPTATNLAAGTYTVTVTDNNGCSETISVTINQPATGVEVTGITYTQVSCFGGSDGTATVTAVGGAGNYSFLWNPTGQTNSTATNLSIGTYTVVVTDGNGCFTIDSIVIDQPAPITTIFTNVTGSSCHQGSDGTATIAASGGVPNGTNGYTYVWNTVPQQTGATATNLTGGQTYSVIITDANGCTTNNQTTIPQPDPVTLTTTQENVTCFGLTDASATVIPAGGTPGFTFQWDANAGNQTNATATGLGFGSYAVTVSDIFGCSAVTSVQITQPAALVTTETTVDILCKGASTGEAQVLMSGGTGPYLIVWQGGLTNPPTDLSAGTYSYVVTDANNCQLTDSVTINEPATELTANKESVDVTCYDDRDGIINIFPSGGSTPYKYSLNGTNYDNNNSRVGLAAGTYNFYVRDDNGCIYTEEVTIAEPDEFTVDLGPDVDITLGESVNLEVVPTNGIPAYTYTWTPTENLSCIDCANPTVDSLQDDRYITVLVEDSRGCTAEDDIYIRMEKPRYVFIANAFTPNDDGNNDWLFVQGGFGTEKVISFRVYDRWGELVYETGDAPLNDSSYGWNGKYKDQDMNAGVFVWFAEVEFGDGERIVYKGSTTLIR